MSKTLKPMLGCSVERGDLIAKFEKGPLLCSTKLDGIRALVRDGVVLSRSLKPIPNRYVQQQFGKDELEGFDGELIVGPANAKDVFRVTTSGVMSEDGTPNVTYYVFDLWNMPNTPFHNRVRELEKRAEGLNPDEDNIYVVPQARVQSMGEVDQRATEAAEMGYEGLILRNQFGLYKFGRSTVKEAGLLKVKPFVDAEAECVGMVELMHNNNAAFTNELGRTARSSAKDGKVASGMMGALVCRTPEGIEFQIGTGFDEAERLQIWNNKSAFIGRLVKYKSLNVGVKDKPRHSVFLGFRDRRDV